MRFPFLRVIGMSECHNINYWAMLPQRRNLSNHYKANGRFIRSVVEKFFLILSNSSQSDLARVCGLRKVVGHYCFKECKSHCSSFEEILAIACVRAGLPNLLHMEGYILSQTDCGPQLVTVMQLGLSRMKG